jgi:hypothetical protein
MVVARERSDKDSQGNKEKSQKNYEDFNILNKNKVREN